MKIQNICLRVFYIIWKLLTFQSLNSDMPRWMEIGYSFIFWFIISTQVFNLIIILNK